MFTTLQQRIREKIEKQYGSLSCFTELIEAADRMVRAENQFQLRDAVINLGEELYDRYHHHLGVQMVEGSFVHRDRALLRQTDLIGRDNRKCHFLHVFIFQQSKLVRLRVDEEGRDQRDTYVYHKDLIHVSLPRKQVLLAEYRGAERTFEMVLPTYEEAIRYQDKLDELRCHPPDRRRA